MNREEAVAAYKELIDVEGRPEAVKYDEIAIRREAEDDFVVEIRSEPETLLQLETLLQCVQKPGPGGLIHEGTVDLRSADGKSTLWFVVKTRRVAGEPSSKGTRT